MNLNNSGEPIPKLQFHLLEFDKLRDEIVNFSKMERQIEFFTIFASGVMGYFLSGKIEFLVNEGLTLFWWIPSLIVILGFSWSRSIRNHITKIGSYLAEIEKIYGDPDLGWERYLDKNPNEKSWNLFIFITLLLITSIPAIKYTNFHDLYVMTLSILRFF